MESSEEFATLSQDETLKNIPGVNIYDANALEKNVVQKINEDIKRKEEAEEKKKIDHLLQEIRILKNSIEQNEKSQAAASKNNFSEASFVKLKSLTSQNDKLRQQLKVCENKLIRRQFNLQVKRVNSSQNREESIVAVSEDIAPVPPFTGHYDIAVVSAAKSLKERKELIKQGLATPFSLISKEDAKNKPTTSYKLDDAFAESLELPVAKKPSKRRSTSTAQTTDLKQTTTTTKPSMTLKRGRDESQSDEEVDVKRKKLDSKNVGYIPSSESDSEETTVEVGRSTAMPAKRNRLVIDDANSNAYKRRINRYKLQLLKDQAEGYVAASDKVFDGGLRIPGKIWDRLYKYQQTGVKWLWELHTQKTGGILGDEMGLGKTIQVIAFLAALRDSKIRDRDSSYCYDGLGPVLIVAPATVMHQWIKELHSWGPLLRSAVLHSSGSHKGSQKELIKNIAQARGILVTSYERVRLALDKLLDQAWHYVILDEGHKIRNPEAGITHAVKLFPTPHRLILSGSPIQNHLRELWSLFDFVFPGKLGTLPVFMEQFSVPIMQGGYANASEVEVQTAYKCACMLRNTISPYLLRRMKQDVQSHIRLPEKNDQVLFCSLTDHQIEVYQNYLSSDSVHSILSGNLKVFVGLIQLRKICNHPDLYTGGPKILVGDPTPGNDDERKYGFWRRSGKMIVVESLLRIWKRQGRKVLLFTQSKMMLDVLEDFVKSKGYTYLTLHGGSSINARQPMIQTFNEDPGIFIFILTTRVGGLGVNLIGADRVIIYDPDWNPSTDSQAQERAWRIGQRKQVTIYRLLTTGTIEEKIYHRQIFKHFVSNRILKDPRQRRFFKANDMHELFMLNYQEKDPSKNKTETAAIFAGTGSEVKIKPARAKTIASAHSSRNRNQDYSRPRQEASLSSSDRCPEDLPLGSKQEKVALKFHENTTPLPSAKETSIPENVRLASDDNTVSKKEVLSSGACVINNSESAETESTFLTEQVASTTLVNRSPSIETQTRKHEAATAVVLENQASTSHANSNDSTSKSEKLKMSFLKALQKFKQSKKQPVEKHDKPKSKKRARSSVDGRAVRNVVKQSTYKRRTEESEAEQKKSDDYVLAKLFTKGVHSAMKHSKIMESSTADYALVESEANRVAKEAIKNVRKSRQQYRFPQTTRQSRFGKGRSTQSSSRPTTSDGASTSAKILFGKTEPTSSALLLNEIRKRNRIETVSVEESSDEEANELEGDNLTEDGKLLHSLVEFIASRSEGQVYTQDIMDEFQNDVATKRAPHFKAMLHQVCVSSEGVDGKTKWILKPEFR